MCDQSPPRQSEMSQKKKKNTCLVPCSHNHSVFLLFPEPFSNCSVALGWRLQSQCYLQTAAMAARAKVWKHKILSQTQPWNGALSNARYASDVSNRFRNIKKCLSSASDIYGQQSSHPSIHPGFIPTRIAEA